jgi:predicted dienelactone hydrolase
VPLACGSGDNGSDVAMVTRSERTWIDTSRNLPRTPVREVRVLLWDPGLVRRLPLVVLAHGFGGLPEKFDAFARAVAQSGFMAAAPAFPLTNESAPGGHQRGFADTVNQPGDISFLLDRLLELNAEPGDALFSRIDPQRIALLGHSLGGLTALAVTRKPCCLDPRIGAAVLVAPLPDFGHQFGTDPISLGPPTLIIHGTADPTIPFQSSVDLYGDFQAPRFLVGLSGAGHSEALESQLVPAVPARQAAEAATIAFLRAEFYDAIDGFQAALDDLAADGHAIQRDS